MRGSGLGVVAVVVLVVGVGAGGAVSVGQEDAAGERGFGILTQRDGGTDAGTGAMRLPSQQEPATVSQPGVSQGGVVREGSGAVARGSEGLVLGPEGSGGRLQQLSDIQERLVWLRLAAELAQAEEALCKAALEGRRPAWCPQEIEAQRLKREAEERRRREEEARLARPAPVAPPPPPVRARFGPAGHERVFRGHAGQGGG